MFKCLFFDDKELLFTHNNTSIGLVVGLVLLLCFYEFELDLLSVVCGIMMSFSIFQDVYNIKQILVRLQYCRGKSLYTIENYRKRLTNFR